MVRFGSLSSQARAMSPAVVRRLGGEPGLVEDVEERHRRNPERLRDREPLGIDRRGDAADRLRDALAIEQEIAAAALDPAGIHDHAGRMEDRVDVAEPGLQHARSP